MRKLINNKMIRYTVLVLVVMSVFAACTDAPYQANFVDLNPTNSYLKYTDTTVVVKLKVSSAIPVVKADSFSIVPYVPFRIVLDTLTGLDEKGAAISYNKYAGQVAVDAKTGEIKINSSVNATKGWVEFVPGTYKFYIGIMTSNGIYKMREKTITVKMLAK